MSSSTWGGAAPAPFALLHPRDKTPWNALHVIFGVGFLASVAVFALIGSYNAYVWWATTSTFFAMMTFLFVNLAVILLNREKVFTSVQGFLLYAMIPLLGIAADAYIVVQSFFIELWQQPWATGKSVVIFDVALALIAVFLALIARRQTPVPLEGDPVMAA